ncbi:MAG: DUF2153 domain-containing protein [Desulfurococcales archaeon]|nr:DUF2153 domain-containing protein [Desulfurococcales archaeon]
MPRDISEFTSTLEKWVRMQESVLKTFMESDERISNADRLEIVTATRIAFNHLIRTLKAFDQWLQDPFIVTHIPRDMLLEVWRETLKALEIIVKLDIKHTSEVKQLIAESYYEGKLNPIVSQLRFELLGEEETRRGGVSLSM